MKHLKLTFVGLLAFTAAASVAFAQGPPPPSMGGGPGDAASGAAGNVAAPGLGGNVASGNVVGGSLTSGGNVTGDRGTLESSDNVTVFRGSRDNGSGVRLPRLGRVCGRRHCRSRSRIGGRIERQGVRLSLLPVPILRRGLLEPLLSALCHLVCGMRRVHATMMRCNAAARCGLPHRTHRVTRGSTAHDHIGPPPQARRADLPGR